MIFIIYLFSPKIWLQKFKNFFTWLEWSTTPKSKWNLIKPIVLSICQQHYTQTNYIWTSIYIPTISCNWIYFSRFSTSSKKLSKFVKKTNIHNVPNIIWHDQYNNPKLMLGWLSNGIYIIHLKSQLLTKIAVAIPVWEPYPHSIKTPIPIIIAPK
jgi:hypothetical protein